MDSRRRRGVSLVYRDKEGGSGERGTGRQQRGKVRDVGQVGVEEGVERLRQRGAETRTRTGQNENTSLEVSVRVRETNP